MGRPIEREWSLCSRLIATDKGEGQVRPLAIGGLFARVAGQVALDRFQPHEKLLPNQWGCGTGPDVMFHRVRLTMETGRATAGVTLHMKNCFNQIDRIYIYVVLFRRRRRQEYDFPQGVQSTILVINRCF